jgi:voltage-gated potassium channel
MPSPRRIAADPRWLRVLLPLSIALLLVAYFELPLDEFGPGRPALSWTVFVIAMVILSLLLLREIDGLLRPGRQGRHAVGILLLICLSLVIFASGYYAMSHHPGEFNGLHTRLDALYFTVITVSTVGFGDISPAGQAARAVVVVQIVYNFVFLAAAVSALSSRVRGRVADRAHSRRDEPGSGGGRAGRGKSGHEKSGRGKSGHERSGRG